MVQIQQIELDGGKAQGTMILSPGGEGHPNMIVIECGAGYLMCGYLNMAAAEKFGDAAVLVSGADFAAVLANPIRGMTPAAAALGVTEGMTGLQAAEVLSR